MQKRKELDSVWNSKVSMSPLARMISLRYHGRRIELTNTFDGAFTIWKRRHSMSLR